VKPVVFIHGFPASELHDSRGRVVFPPSPGTLLKAARKQAFLDAVLDIPGDLLAGPPIRSILGIAKQAQSLYDILDRLGCPVAPVGWDWRLGVDDATVMNAVADNIRSFAPQNVVLLVHSTGALVARAFLAAHPDLASSIDEVLAFGGAWCGTLDALYAVHHGRSESIFGIPLLSADDGANVVGHSQAAYDLFPLPDVQLVHDSNGNAVSPNVDLEWLKPGRDYARPLAASANARLGARDPDFGALPMTNVAGWGGPTWPAAVLEPNDVYFLAPEKDSGDGTVPFVSTDWIRGANVRTVVVPIGAFVNDPVPDVHTHLWDSVAVQQIFEEVLNDAPRTELIAAAADADEAIDYESGSVTVRMVAQSADGQPLPQCVAIANVGGRRVPVPFGNQRSAILRVSRDGITHNAGNDVYRFTIDFKWNGGSRNGVAVSFRSV